MSTTIIIVCGSQRAPKFAYTTIVLRNMFILLRAINTFKVITPILRLSTKFTYNIVTIVSIPPRDCGSVEPYELTTNERVPDRIGLKF